MSDHSCPKIVRVFAPYYLHGYMDQVHSNVHCDVCHARCVEQYRPYVQYLPELRAWMEGDVDAMSRDCEYLLHEHFSEDMDYGTLTGDTNTFDQWICDRPRYIEDLIGTIEYYHPEMVPA